MGAEKGLSNAASEELKIYFMHFAAEQCAEVEFVGLKNYNKIASFCRSSPNIRSHINLKMQAALLGLRRDGH